MTFRPLSLNGSGLMIRMPEREPTDTTGYQPQLDIARMELDDVRLAHEIVARFNMHEELVEALEAAYDELTRRDPFSATDPLIQRRRQVQAAIVKAKAPR